jgi:hypothetical protein
MSEVKPVKDGVEESRWIGIVCKVFGFRPKIDSFGDDQFAIPGDADSWLVSDDEHIWVVLHGRFTVAVYWAGGVESAFWFENERTYEMSEKDMKSLDAVDKLSGGEFKRLAADWVEFLGTKRRAEITA